jgi:hypothetical protein
MAIEVGEPPSVVGERFTTFFARSRDGLLWTLYPECYDTKTHYSAAPFLCFANGWYYLFTAYRRTGKSKTSSICVARSQNLRNWDWSPLNPVLEPTEEDHLILFERFSDAQRRYIDTTPVLKVSDFDICNFGCRSIIHYSWGYRGRMFYNRGEYEGSVEEFCRGWYPEC